MTRFITILSGKGGVGKTTIAINLGAALRRLGKDIIILDGNLTTPDIGVYFGISNFPVNLSHVLKNENEIKDAIYLHPQGFKIVPGALNNSQFKHIDTDFKNVFEKLRGLTEVVIVDASSGLGKTVRKLLQLSDEVLIVTNPDLLSVTNALKAINLAEEKEATVLGIILNKLKDKNEMDINSIESMLGTTVIGEIPYDETIVKARVQKRPLIFTYPEAESAVSIKKLAAKLIGDDYIPSKKRFK